MIVENVKCEIMVDGVRKNESELGEILAEFIYKYPNLRIEFKEPTFVTRLGSDEKQMVQNASVDGYVRF